MHIGIRYMGKKKKKLKFVKCHNISIYFYWSKFSFYYWSQSIDIIFYIENYNRRIIWKLELANTNESFKHI